MQVLEAVRLWWIESGLLAYRMNDTGTLRTLILREGKRTGDKLIMLTVSGNPTFAMNKEQRLSFVEAISAVVGKERVAIFLRVQQIAKGFETQFFEMHLNGPDHLLEKCTVGGEEFTFKISPSSFFQPNTQMAEVIYAEALKLIDEPVEHLMDLYAGIGTLGLVCARKAKRVTAIELNPYAVYDAQSNQELSGIEHYTVVCGDVGKILMEKMDESDCLIVDPPRTGLDKTAMQIILRMKPKKIIYISCSPQTQVENMRSLMQEGYSVDHLQPVDQFPHTPHIEMVSSVVIKE
jgi:23S rRNA (uracil1939-C5)-methyltransferase